MADRSGGSDTYDNVDALVPKAGVDDPKAEEPKVEAARALLACDFPGRLLIVEGRMGEWEDEIGRGEGGDEGEGK